MGRLKLAVLDTSVLIDGSIPAEFETAISTVSIAELHFGLLVSTDEEMLASRAARLGMIEARYPDPLPVDDQVAREWGRLQAAVSQRGGKPRSRNSDLAIAATANVHGAALLTLNGKDLRIVDDLIDVRSPS